MQQNFLKYALPLITAIFLTPAASFACPLGNNETTISFARIMRNFGRFTLTPDSVALKGWQGEAVLEEEVTKSINDLDITLSCAQIILQDTAKNLMPPKYYLLTGNEQNEYNEDFMRFMNQFVVALNEYKELFIELEKQNLDAWNFEKLYKKSQELTEIANTAHNFL